jgi:hypothetical protein
MFHPLTHSLLLMIEQIPQLDGETGTRARSVWAAYTLCFANIPITTWKAMNYFIFQAAG